MSVFECARCNALTYSASRAANYRCETCGSPKARILEDQTFDTAVDVERTPRPRDHCGAVHYGPDTGAMHAAPSSQPVATRVSSGANANAETRSR